SLARCLEWPMGRMGPMGRRLVRTGFLAVLLRRPFRLYVLALRLLRSVLGLRRCLYLGCDPVAWACLRLQPGVLRRLWRRLWRIYSLRADERRPRFRSRCHGLNPRQQGSGSDLRRSRAWRDRFADGPN